MTKLFLRIGDSSGQSATDGVPRTEKILASWSVSYLPGNKGLRVNSSARIQPHDQISTGVAYEVPSNTSGARYHSVTT